MNKTNLTDEVVKLTGLKKKDADLAVNAVFAKIEEALKAAGVEVDKKNITLGEIKTVGEYEGSVKCYKAVKATVKVTVEAEA